MPARAPQRLPELGLDPQREYRLGIMGGTFDPVHYGHLVTAEQAREALDLDLVLFMPAGSPAFKDDEVVTSAEDPLRDDGARHCGKRRLYRQPLRDRSRRNHLHGRYAQSASRVLSR